MKPPARAKRSYLRIMLGLAYVACFVWIAVSSYHAPTYEFLATSNILCVSVIGTILTLLWRGRPIPRLAWLLPIAVIAIAITGYGNTSRDWLRYLFDGQMIHLWHLSPYVHLPPEFPPDQYSRLFLGIWWNHIGSPYGPLWQALMVVINTVTHNQLVGGLIALKVVNLAALLVAARYLFLITKHAWVSFIFLINPVILIDTVATPHPDIVIAAALLAACYYQRNAIRGGLVALSGLIKIHALIFAPLLSRQWRNLWRLGLWTVATFLVVAFALKGFVGFDWLPMLRAGQGGGVSGQDSLLMYNLLPGASYQTVNFASYGLFAAGYLALLVSFWRGKISSLTAVTLATFLVPMCLTGVLLPWHFILPLALLLACPGRVAYWGVLFITLLVLKSSETVLVLIIMAVVLGLGGSVLHRLTRRLERPPKLLLRLIKLVS